MKRGRKSKFCDNDTLQSKWNVALYIRLSVQDGDKAESNSVANQRELLDMFIKKDKELNFYNYYIDDRYILEGANDVRCILSDNLTGFIIDDKRNVDRIRDFLNEFVEPIGHYCINEMLEKGEIDVFDLDYIIKENIYG